MELKCQFRFYINVPKVITILKDKWKTTISLKNMTVLWQIHTNLTQHCVLLRSMGFTENVFLQ